MYEEDGCWQLECRGNGSIDIGEWTRCRLVILGHDLVRGQAFQG